MKTATLPTLAVLFACRQQRRKELPEIFDREIYGRVPEAANTINFKWEVTGTTEGCMGFHAFQTTDLLRFRPFLDRSAVQVLSSAPIPSQQSGGTSSLRCGGRSCARSVSSSQ
jgi:hypothetical protein